jgi:hypothetical protein
MHTHIHALIKIQTHDTCDKSGPKLHGTRNGQGMNCESVLNLFFFIYI